MGTDIAKTQFNDEDYRKYRQRLHEELRSLRRVLDQPGFGEGPASFGAELELYIIDDLGCPKAINTQLYEAMQDTQLTLELNRFNLEYNFKPVTQQDAPFTLMRQQMLSALGRLSELASQHQARVLPIGILPTLKREDLGPHAITDLPRYHVLARTLRDKRGEDFHVDIEGKEHLDLHWSDVSLEGANTSFQFHYRVNPNDFADAFNAAQLVTPLVLALAANSPLFLGRQLWQETRIALFKQSIDTRLDDALAKHLPARVLFGLGWVRESIHELFAEGTYLFEPLMPIWDQPVDDDQAPVPELPALRLHQGSIWSWNRPIYDPADGGHVRIELRALPAGPTPSDMIAGAALHSGLIRGLQHSIRELLPAMPFRYAEQNFYRAAKHGLDATLIWPNPQRGQLEERSALHLLQCMLPTVEDGLHQLGVSDAEIKQQCTLLRATLAQNTNGAKWQSHMYQQLKNELTKEEALRVLAERYYENSSQDLPVHKWSTHI